MTDRAPSLTLASKRAGAFWGSLVGDALAMPIHWYYSLAALRRDYGEVRDFVAPRSPHADSILWRSQYTALNERGDILRDQARFWGVHGVHYHQFLLAGENTLNLQLSKTLAVSLIECGGYDAADYLKRYIDFMLTPGMHRDTYVEEYHRKFFTQYARGIAPEKCGGSDIHIGGLAHVGVLAAALFENTALARKAVARHLNLTHRAPAVIAAGDALTRMICDVLDGADLRESIFEHGADWFSRRKAAQWSEVPDSVVVGQKVSSACYIQDAFPGSLFLAWKYAASFEEGVIANANVGGDNCHRGAVVGALLGAANGTGGIPLRWRENLHDAQNVRTLSERLFSPAKPANLPWARPRLR